MLRSKVYGPNRTKQHKRVFKDPVLLPEELFTLAQSFLSPFSIANSLSVNKSWRNVILKSPILFRDLDLSKLGRKSEMHLIIFHANRIANLSQHTLVRVSLDLICFEQDYAKKPKGKMTGLDILLDIIHQSKETIEEIVIKFKDQYDHSQECTLYLIRALMSRFITFQRLCSVSFTAPSIVSIEAKQEDGPKSFKLLNNVEEVSWNHGNSGLGGDESILEMIETVQRFISEPMKITRFGTEENEESFPLEAGVAIQAKLLPHQSTIRELQIGLLQPLNAQDLFNLGFGCHSMEVLTLYLDLPLPEDVEETHRILRIPMGLEKAKSLKSLHLRLNNNIEDDEDPAMYQIDWKGLSKRVGGRLEELTVSYSRSIDPIGFLSSNLVSKSKKTLRRLHLSGMLFHYKDLPPARIFQSFPNLESLTLDDLSASTYKWFSRVHCPNLISLKIWHFHETASLLDLEHVNALLENVSLRLRKLEIKFLSEEGLYEEEEPRLENFSMSFPRVMELNLSITESGEAYPKWLSNFSFPNLVKLTGVNEEIHQLFQKNSLKLPAFSNVIVVRRT